MNLDIAATGLAPPHLTSTITVEPDGGPGSGSPAVSTGGRTSQAAVSDDTIPASPPPEVMDEIAAAMHAADRLAAGGREVRFDLDSPTGKVSAGLHDLEGHLLSKLALSEVLDVADGGSAG